jgi:hypothetical protein
VELGGYQQELKRTLGSFQVFAISFAFISVAVGRHCGTIHPRMRPVIGHSETTARMVCAALAS